MTRLHPPRHRQHKGHGGHSAHEGGDDERYRTGEHPAIEENHHGQGHGQLGSAGNAHDEGPGDGVCKEGLQQVARRAEGRTQQRRHHRARQTQLQNDVHGKRVLPLAQKCRQHCARRKGHTAPEQVQRKQHSQRRRKGKIGDSKASGTGHRHSFR